MGAARDDDPFALLGALSLDIYLGRDLVLPGGGVLNMAWHWRRDGTPFELLSRVGDDRPEVFDVVPRPARDPPLPGARDAGPVGVDRHRHPARPPAVHGQLRRGRVVDVRPHRRGGAPARGRPAAAPRARRGCDPGARAAGERRGASTGSRSPRTSSASATTRSSGSGTRCGSWTWGSSGWPGSPDDPDVAGIRAVAHELGRLDRRDVRVAGRARVRRPGRTAVATRSSR